MFSWADNQIWAVSVFTKTGLMIGADDIRDDAEVCISKIVEGLEVYCADYEMRDRCGERMKGVVDGNGVGRICELVIILIKI